VRTPLRRRRSRPRESEYDEVLLTDDSVYRPRSPAEDMGAPVWDGSLSPLRGGTPLRVHSGRLSPARSPGRQFTFSPGSQSVLRVSPGSQSNGSFSPAPDGMKLICKVHSIEAYTHPSMPSRPFVAVRYAGREVAGEPADESTFITEVFEFPYAPPHGLVLRLLDANRGAGDAIGESQMLEIEKLFGLGSAGHWRGELDLFKSGGDSGEGSGIRGKLLVSLQLAVPFCYEREMRFDVPLPTTAAPPRLAAAMRPAAATLRAISPARPLLRRAVSPAILRSAIVPLTAPRLRCAQPVFAGGAYVMRPASRIMY